MQPFEEQKLLRKQMGRIEASKGLTFYLFGATLLILITATTAGVNGSISTACAWAILIPAYYFVAMCVHDAVHFSAHSVPQVNRWVGWIGSVLLGMTFPVIRRSHMQHHRAADHSHDTEAFVYRSALTLPLRLLVANLACYRSLVAATRREQAQGVFLLFTIAIALVLKPGLSLFAWIIPMQIAVGLFALNTVYLPHGPFARWLHLKLPSVTGFHWHHHCMPQLPWYQLFKIAYQTRKHQARRNAV